MEKDEKTAFYLNIPLFMHNCPHMFLMQQNMMAQQQQMQRQMAGQGAGIRSSQSSATSTSIASGNVTHEPGHQMMNEVLSDPDSKTRLTTLSARVTGRDSCYCYYYYHYYYYYYYYYYYHYCYCYNYYYYSDYYNHQSIS